MLFKFLILCWTISLIHCSYEKQKTTSDPDYQARAYKFGYEINDGYNNKQYFNENSDSNNVKKGSYGFIDAYGMYRTVDYIADDKGFRVNIKSNEPGLGAQKQVKKLSSLSSSQSKYTAPIKETSYLQNSYEPQKKEEEIYSAPKNNYLLPQTNYQSQADYPQQPSSAYEPVAQIKETYSAPEVKYDSYSPSQPKYTAPVKETSYSQKSYEPQKKEEEAYYAPKQQNYLQQSQADYPQQPSPAYEPVAQIKETYSAPEVKYEQVKDEEPKYEQVKYEQPKYEQMKYEKPKYKQPKYEQPKYEQVKYEQVKYEEPKYEQPKYTQPKYEQPKYEQVKYEEPKYEQPKYEQVKYEEPKYTQPKYEQVKYEEPKYEQPKYEQPKYEEPKYEQVKYEQPKYTQPKYEQPKYEQVKYEEPKYEQPKYEQPKYEQPKYEQVKYEEPKYEQVKYEQPKYTQPKYEQVKYEEPKYEQPKYKQAKYEEPKYEQPTYEKKYASYEQAKYKALEQYHLKENCEDRPQNNYQQQAPKYNSLTAPETYASPVEALKSQKNSYQPQTYSPQQKNYQQPQENYQPNYAPSAPNKSSLNPYVSDYTHNYKYNIVGMTLNQLRKLPFKMVKSNNIDLPKEVERQYWEKQNALEDEVATISEEAQTEKPVLAMPIKKRPLTPPSEGESLLNPNYY